MKKEKEIEEVKMENLIGKKLVGSRTGRIIQAKAVGEDVVLSIQRDGHPGTLSVQFSKEEVEALQRGEEVSGFRIVDASYERKATDYKEIVKQLKREINRKRRQLMEKAKKKGLYENFGQAEFREIWDKYGKYIYDFEFRELGGGALLDEFRDWIKNFDLSYIKESIRRDENTESRRLAETVHFGVDRKKQRGELYSSETEKGKKSAQSGFEGRRRELRKLKDKWYKKGIEAGKSENWMNVEETLPETLEKMPELDDPVDLVWTDIGLWEETDHFSVLYGKPMMEDVSKIFEDAEDRNDAFSEVKDEFWEGYLQGRKAIGIDIYKEAEKLISEKSKRKTEGKAAERMEKVVRSLSSTILKKRKKIADLLDKKQEEKFVPSFERPLIEDPAALWDNMALWARRVALENIGIKKEEWKKYDRSNMESLPEDVKTLLTDYLKRSIEQTKKRRQEAKQLWEQYKPQLDKLVEEISKGRGEHKDVFYSDIHFLTKKLPNRKTARIVKADNKPKYKAVLFAIDGDWVTDFPGETIDEVKDKLANRGSLWYFYPIEGVMRYTGSFTSSNEKVIEMAPPFDFLSGKTIRGISEWLEENQDEVADFLNKLYGSSSRIKRTAGRIGTDDKIPSFGKLTPTNMVMSEPVPTYPPALAAEDVIRVMRYMKGFMDANSAYEFVIQHIPYVTPHYEEEVKAELKRMGIFIK
jgi:hypothetical protein